MHDKIPKLCRLQATPALIETPALTELKPQQPLKREHKTQQVHNQKLINFPISTSTATHQHLTKITHTL